MESNAHLDPKLEKQLLTGSQMRPLARLAFPIALTMLANNVLQIVDMIFVGKLGTAALGAVSLSSSLYVVVMILGIGLLTALDYWVSFAVGKKDFDAANNYLVGGVYIALLVSLPSIGLLYIASYMLPSFGIVPEVAALAGDYLRSLSWSLLPFLAYFALRQYLQATGVTAIALLLTLGANLVNAYFNWTLIPVFGIAGSAHATTISRLFMLVGILIYLRYRNKKYALGLERVSFAMNTEILKRLAKLGLPAAGQLGLEVGVFSLVTMLAGKLGNLPLASHAVALQIASNVFMFPLGLSSAAAVLVGRCLGLGDKALARHTGWTAIRMAGVMMIGIAATVYLFSGPLQSIFTTDPEVLRVGTALLLIATVFQISDGLQVVSTGALRGAGNSKVPLMANLLGHWLVGLPVGYTLAFTLGHGVYGLWIGLAVGLTCVAIALVWYWSRYTKVWDGIPAAAASGKNL